MLYEELPQSFRRQKCTHAINKAVTGAKLLCRSMLDVGGSECVCVCFGPRTRLLITSRTHNKSIAKQAEEPNHLTEYRLSAYAIHFFFFSSHLILSLSTSSDSFPYLSHFWFYISHHLTIPTFLSISL